MPGYWVCLLSAALVCIFLLAPREVLAEKGRFFLVFLQIVLLAIYGFITAAGIVALSIMAAAMYLAVRENLHALMRILSAIVAIIFVFALSMNLLPGFTRIAIEAPAYLGNATQPFAMNIGFAKSMVGLLLLLFWVRTEVLWRDIVKKLLQASPAIVVFPVVILLLASCLGWALDPKWYSFSLVFIIGNFCLSTVAEEAFFRATLQDRARQFLVGRTGYAGFISLVCVSLFFGALHWSGGAVYTLLASLAGLAYGWIYWRFNSLHAAIACHLLLNALHFVFLLYPR